MADILLWTATASFEVRDITLISDGFSVPVAPDNARLLMRVKQVDDLTVNTDIKGYVSADGGDTWDQVTLEDRGKSDGITVYAGSVELSHSGANLKYKITSHNLKKLEIHDAAVRGN